MQMKLFQTKIQNVDPHLECDMCPRLVEFRQNLRQTRPHDWYNSPVPTFKADDNVKLLIVGLAPGMKGANRTGRVFTNDFAGDLLYPTLKNFKFSSGEYTGHVNDGLQLVNCAITNAIRCVPPQNKPVAAEINNCRIFLKNTIERFTQLNSILALGRIAHETLLRTFELELSSYPFKHATRHLVGENLTLFDSYHCSRYNTNTGVLTEQMFHDVFVEIRKNVDES